MLLHYTEDTLLGERVVPRGARVEVADGLAARHLASGRATIAVEFDDGPAAETADAPPAARTADAPPGKRRRP